MKTMKYIYALATLTVLLSACSSEWLHQQPQGSTITEEQFREKADKLHGSVYGAYALMYQYGGDHDVFGFRSIDMYGDLNCGDMALPVSNYGWFEYDERGMTYARRSYYWYFYYGIIRQCNKGIVYAKETKDADGNALDLSFLNYFEDDVQITDSITAHKKYIEANKEVLNYYAQLIALRSWSYANLQKYFVPTPDEADWETVLSVPIYTEADVLQDTTLGNPRIYADSVARFVIKDMTIAVRLLQATEKAGFTRAMKQEINSEVALLNLAYFILNSAGSDEDWFYAYAYAEEFITKTSAPILANEKVLTTGFADINETNWIWGQDVTIQTTTSLASFFGQVDIFTYSYAWARDVKAIDNALYKMTTATTRSWDIRSKWWNNMSRYDYNYAPDGKFFNPSTVNYKKAPQADALDRAWLCDHVFMRAELGYLIAAEANWRYGNDAKAIQWLTKITDQRIKDDKTATQTKYEKWKTSLSNHSTLGEEIRYNWRIEMWGEGYGMQTFRRYGETVTLGTNHLVRKNEEIRPSDPRKFTFELPTSELEYNPAIRRQNKELEVK